MTFYFSQEFKSFDEMTASFSLWDADIHQLQRGKTVNHLTEFSTGDLSITNGIFKGHTQQTAASPKRGATVAILSDAISCLNWHKHDVGTNGLMIMPPGSELDVVTKAHAGVYTITISGKTLEKIIGENSEIEKILTLNQLLESSAATTATLRLMILRYLSLLNQTPVLINQASFLEELNSEISGKIVACLTGSCDAPAPINLLNKKKVWSQIEDIFVKHSGIDIRVSEISRMLKVSESSLLRLFKERFGLSPKSYINMMRLNGLYKELKNGVEGNTTIYDCANHWGFWHMGQLAKDYKRMFGELPSETLKK